jgi:hypothetical protein
MCGCGVTKGVESKECLVLAASERFGQLKTGWLEQCFVRSHAFDRNLKIFR